MDLTEVTTETDKSLETALSLIQQIRHEETGPVIEELEILINQIHLISGEYRP